MKITKYGHCCLLIETQNRRILTDPGSYSSLPADLRGVNAVLITHEHQDHLHLDALKPILASSPQAEVITNHGVERALRAAQIRCRLLEDGQEYVLSEKIRIAGYGTEHADIYRTIVPVVNTGYFIDDTLFYPGDAFTLPDRQVPCLALPVAGPWLNIAQAVEYAIAVNPKRAFPVHDGNLKSAGIAHRLPAEVLPKSGISFAPLVDRQSIEV